ncbi:unnamed protein product [Prorocentrum cordatum]|uniref:Uncharacterized protein n=1 Tax=Prorocentrum cordatum TaxID=2364126 RepID=A0ABN9T600_9DINO|nr:unnamed protein product [Polarella glacialis]
MASALRPRRPRPRESQFVHATLADKWDAKAVLKDPGFAWDGSGYGSSRTQAIDETSMLPYAEVLKTLLEVAPSGFPAQKCLKDTFQELDKRHGILACDMRFQERAASLAADAWRVMAKHLYNAAQADKALSNEVLQQLVKMIRLPSAEDDGGAALASGGSFEDSPSFAAAAGPVEGEAADVSASAVRALFPPSMGEAAEGDGSHEAAKTEVEFSDDDVELCGMTCKCKACRDARTVDLTAEEGGGERAPIPNAAIGGQKRDTRTAQTALKVRMRLLGKTRETVALILKPPKKAKAPPKQEDEAEVESGNITLPATVTVREPNGKRRGEAYMLDGNKKYIMGITSRRTEEYKEVVERAAEKINGTILKTKDDLRMWFDQQIGFDTGPMGHCLEKMQAAVRAGTAAAPVKAEPVDSSVGSSAPAAAAVVPATGDTDGPAVKVAKREGDRVRDEEAPALKEPRVRPGAQADASVWVHDWIESDKAAYNAFMYRLRKQGQERKAKWKEIQKFGCAMDADNFVDEIMRTTTRQSAEFNNTLTRNETLKEWTTFKKALEKYDEDVLMAMIRARTLETKRDPAIPESLLVPWPKYLQVRLHSESERDRHDKGLQLTDNTTLDDDAYDEKYAEQSRGHNQQQGGQQQQQPPQQQQSLQTEPSVDKAKMPEAVAVAVKAARAAHGYIDRFVRELEAAIESSSKNENSKGDKIENDLDAMRGTLAAKDKELLTFEKKCVSSNGAGITGKEIQTAADLAKEIDDAIKNGRKKLAALRSLWKL